MTTSKDTAELVTSREETHGNYADVSRIAQSIKQIISYECSMRIDRDQKPLFLAHVESLEMIAVKIGRIIAGDPTFQDHWDDIAGYARIANGQR